jgi:hypothetical protein
MGAAQGKNWALGAAALVAASSLTRLPHYSANTISNRDYTLGCFLSRPPRRAVRKSRPAARRCSAAGISHVRSQVHRRSGCCRAALLNNHPPPTLSQRRTHSACGVCVCARLRHVASLAHRRRLTRPFGTTEKERADEIRHQQKKQQSVHRRHTTSCTFAAVSKK